MHQLWARCQSIQRWHRGAHDLWEGEDEQHDTSYLTDLRCPNRLKAR